MPDPNSADYPEGSVAAVTSSSFVNYEDAGGVMVDRVAFETVIDRVNNATVTHYAEDGRVLDVMQGVYDPGTGAIDELTTSRTWYTENLLPYAAGVTTGEPNAWTWHSVSLTFYDGQNRVTKSVQVDVHDTEELGSVFNGTPAYGYVKSHDAMAGQEWSHIMSEYGYFETPITEGEPPD